MKTLIPIIVILFFVGCSNEVRLVEDANTMLQTELEKSNEDRDIFYLKSIDNNIREYHIAE